MGKRALVLAAMSTVLGVSTGVQAANDLLRVNYDDLTPTYSYGYAYGGGSHTFAVMSGVGVSESSALQITANGSGAAGNLFWGFGGGSGILPPLTPVGSNVGVDQFTYSFDVLLSGFDNPVTSSGINITLALNAPDGTINDPNGSSDKIADIVIDTADYNVELGGFQTISGTFAGAGFDQPGQADLLPQFFAAINQVQLNINANGGGDFGFGPGPYIAIFDNLVVTQLIPGPEFLLGDFDFDGEVLDSDIAGFVSALLGDFDSLIAQFPERTAEDFIFIGDFDGDGEVLDSDIEGFVNALLGVGGRPGTAAIPEPAALGLLAPAGLLISRRRRA